MAGDSFENTQTQQNDFKQRNVNQLIEQCVVMRSVEVCIQTDSHNGSIQPILHHGLDS